MALALAVLGRQRSGISQVEHFRDSVQAFSILRKISLLRYIAIKAEPL